MCIIQNVQSFMCACDVSQVRCDLQSTHGHQRGPTGHHHLGHSHWTEEERLPLRELCTLAYIQVSSLSLLVKLHQTIFLLHLLVSWGFF